MPAKNKRTRIGGQGYTVFTWEGEVIALAESVTVTAPQPVSPAQPIQPLNATEPIEIITAGAHGPGTLTLTLTELYESSVWQRLSGLANSQDLVDIMRTIASIDKSGGIQLQKIVIPPVKDFPTYVETFYNCVISNVTDNETIDIRAMQIQKDIEVMFTHSKKSWINNGNRQNPPNSFNVTAP
jgi:hypothetical protein